MSGLKSPQQSLLAWGRSRSKTAAGDI